MKSLKILYLSTYLTHIRAFFNSDYFKYTIHNIEILKTPINFQQHRSKSNVKNFLISNKNGRQFSCILPGVEEISQIDNLGWSEVPELDPELAKSDQNKEESDESRQNFQNTPEFKKLEFKSSQMFKILNKIQATPLPEGLKVYKNTPDEEFTEKNFPRDECIYYSDKNWWSYELCINQYVRQFHWTNNKTPKQITNIGQFEKDVKWVRTDVDQNLLDVANGKTPKDVSSQEIDAMRIQIANLNKNDASFEDFRKFYNKNIHVQYYNLGDTCEVTKKPRKAKVIYKCVDRTVDFMKIQAISEPETCTYQFMVHSPQMCEYSSYYEESKQQNKKQSNILIKCSKILTDEEYVQWENLQEKIRIENEVKETSLLKDFLKETREMAENRYVQAEDEEAELEEPETPAVASPKSIKEAVTAKTLEAVGNMIATNFNKMIDENDRKKGVSGQEDSDSDDNQIDEEEEPEIQFISSGNLSPEQEEKIKQQLKEQMRNYQKSEKAKEEQNKKLQASKNFKQNLNQVENEKLLDDTSVEAKSSGSLEKEIKFTDIEGNDLELKDTDSNIPDQLKALKKSIEDEIRNNGEDMDGDVLDKLGQLPQFKLQIIDENGNRHEAQDISVDS